MAKKSGNIPRTLFSILKTRDRRYFKELFGNMMGIKIPGPCRFCKKEAYHIFETTLDGEDQQLTDEKVFRFLCCDDALCLSKAMPELFEKFRTLVPEKPS